MMTPLLTLLVTILVMMNSSAQAFQPSNFGAKCCSKPSLLAFVSCSNNKAKLPTESSSALAASVSSTAKVLKATYKTGTLDSGVPNLVGTKATAHDAAFVSTEFARSGTFSIGHKVILGNPEYYSNGKARSESDTLDIMDTRYKHGTDAKYEFSILLHDWKEYDKIGTPIDIIWQFKHTDGGPDAMFGIKRNSLVLRYGGGSATVNGKKDKSASQIDIVRDVRPFVNKWIDFQVDVQWRNDKTGTFVVSLKTPNDKSFQRVVSLEDTNTFSDAGKGDFGYLKWGLYRPDSTTENTSALERVVFHDNVFVTKTVLSSKVA